MKSFKWMMVYTCILIMYLLLSIHDSTEKLNAAPVEKTALHTAADQDNDERELLLYPIGVQEYLYH